SARIIISKSIPPYAIDLLAYNSSTQTNNNGASKNNKTVLKWLEVFFFHKWHPFEKVHRRRVYSYLQADFLAVFN
ncbi:MAG TPA: hypothetical protein PKZ53_22200, partial [Acidobacteriota bacterium]|nr:hypothetical protein [Acidobacteriota bacterium]